MDRVKHFTFDEEADIYEKEALAEIKKEKGDGDMSKANAILQMGRGIIYRLRQEIANRVEVVHGRWGEIYTCHGERLWGYKCSQCEQDNPNKSNYCPNCGADMRGKEDGK